MTNYPSRVFEHPNMLNFECPICLTNADSPVVLVPIPGTEQGNIMKAKQVHHKCYELVERMRFLANSQKPNIL
jgi:hypothetical protein